jgi:hypothetical protein
MRTLASRAFFAVALTLIATAGARAEPIDLSYRWEGPSFEVVRANGGTRDGAALFVVPHQVVHNLPVPPISIWAFSAAHGGNDRYNDVTYALKFDVSDPHTGQSHLLRVTGEFNGTVTSDRVNLSNAFTGGSGVQTFDFLGRDVTVTFGFSSRPASAHPWEGHITASVSVGAAPSDQPLALTVGPASVPEPASAPEPATLVLAALALPALGLAGFRCRRSGTRRIRPLRTVAG